jgi:hypothetical protein
LSEQAKDMEQKLGELLAHVEREYGPQPPTEEETARREPAEEGRLSPEDKRRIEQLFEQAEQDRSNAHELKRELDRLDVYQGYEDRFLDLFKKSE